MPAPSSTIIVVPRERFGSTFESLESLFANTVQPYSLIYVDAGSPPDISQRLAELARQRDFTLIRCDSYLTPNQARNLALPRVATRYTVFADNDVFFAPGWLAALERCAEETGADIVSPVTCIGKPLHSLIHHAGGSVTIVERDGRRLFREVQDLEMMRLEQIRDGLVRGPTGTCEFHSVLVRSDVFARHGKLDENLMTSYDHTDLSMKVSEAGGKIFFEPAAVVTYVPRTLEWRELPFFMLRWNRHAARHTVISFLAKRNAEEMRPGCNEIEFMHAHRGHGIPKLHKWLLACAGWRIGSFLIDRIELGLAAIAQRRFAGLGREITARVVHAGSAGLHRAA
jgi:GT2 family glycosyltransferase